MALSKSEIKTAYPLPTYNYRVEIAGVAIGFSEVSGLSISRETTTYKESPTASGVVGPVVMNMPSQRGGASVSLKKGLVKTTSVATLYHYVFGWVAPYGWTSLPKLLGTAGGVLLVLGAVGLLRLRLKRHPEHQLSEQRPMDLGFIALLGLAGASGLALALARGTGAMPPLLCLHLGAVMALFATLPYGKFAHAGYRVAALLKWAIEKRQPSRLKLGSE